MLDLYNVSMSPYDDGERRTSELSLRSNCRECKKEILIGRNADTTHPVEHGICQKRFAAADSRCVADVKANASDG